MTTQAEWDCLPTKIANDAYLTVWNSTIFNNATNWASQPPVKYVFDGGPTGSGILDVSREVQQRVKAFAYAYKISNNASFKDRLYLELNTAAGNTATDFGQNGTHWNPPLPRRRRDDLGLRHGVRLALQRLVRRQRSMIRTAIVDYGLVPGQASTPLPTMVEAPRQRRRQLELRLQRRPAHRCPCNSRRRRLQPDHHR